MKIILTESQLNDVIDKFITFKLEPHEVKYSKEKPNSVFWFKGGEVIACVDKKRNLFLLNEEIWRSITNLFSLDGIETSHFIKNWLDAHYGMEELSPRIAIGMKIRVWDKIKFD